jgi:hypothetical protein
MVQFVQQYSDVIVSDDGVRYVARAYAAPRPDRRWDGWFVFLPLTGGRALATNWETTQNTLLQVKYWAEGISPVYLQGAFKRAEACTSDAILSRRAERAERAEALAKQAALAYAEAAAAARAAAAEAKLNRRDAEAQLIAERAAAARAAAVLQARAARAARAQANAADQRQREFKRRATGGGDPTRPAGRSPESQPPARSSHRRRG